MVRHLCDEGESDLECRSHNVFLNPACRGDYPRERCPSSRDARPGWTGTSSAHGGPFNVPQPAASYFPTAWAKGRRRGNPPGPKISCSARRLGGIKPPTARSAGGAWTLSLDACQNARQASCNSQAPVGREAERLDSRSARACRRAASVRPPNIRASSVTRSRSDNRSIRVKVRPSEISFTTR